MKRFAWFVIASSLFAGLVLTSCKAAGASDTKSDSKAAAADVKSEGITAGEVTFTYTPGEDEEPEEVYLAGDLNGWNAADPNYLMEAGDDGVFSITVELDPGTYKFKFVIDGTWIQSMEDYEGNFTPAAQSYVDDGFGGKNAVIEVTE